MNIIITATLVMAVHGSVNAAQVLPLTRVRLYETGVGYFERHGQVSGDQKTTLPLPASHLDDALKTLVVLNRGQQVQLRGVDFQSSMGQGMARTLAGLPSPEVELSYRDLLGSLEGAEIEAVVQGETVRGKLVEVLGPFFQKGQQVGDKNGLPAKSTYPLEPEYTLVVLTAKGFLKRLQTSAIRSLRPVNKDLQARLHSTLAVISQNSATQPQALNIQVQGRGALSLGYIAEAPVWRTSYRLVLGPKKRGRLQSWALIHNDSDEPWRGVRVELASGKPKSFLYPMAAPRYQRRELATPSLQLSTVPQLLTSTPDQLWGDFSEAMVAQGIGSGGGYGFGSAGIGLGSSGRSSKTVAKVSAATLSDRPPHVGDLTRFAQAASEEQNTVFVYKLAGALDLGPHHSALVPVIQEPIEAEAVSWCNPIGDKTVFAAVRFVNKTSQTLPAGTMALFNTESFLGESPMQRMRPGQRRFLFHGVDQDLEVGQTKVPTQDLIMGVGFSGGALYQKVVHKSDLKIELHNRSQKPRVAYVALSVLRNGEVMGHRALEFLPEKNLLLGRFRLKRGEHLKKVLKVKEGDTQRISGEISQKLLRSYADNPNLSQREREITGRAARLKKRLDDILGEHQQRRQSMEQQKSELRRLRKDLAAFGSARSQFVEAEQLARRMVAIEEQLPEQQRQQKACLIEQKRLGEKLKKTLEELESDQKR